MSSGFQVTYGNDTIDLLNDNTFASSIPQSLISNPENSYDLSTWFNDTTIYETTDISNLFISSQFTKIHTLTSGPGAIHPGAATGYQISGVDLCNNAIARYDRTTGGYSGTQGISRYNQS